MTKQQREIAILVGVLIVLGIVIVSTFKSPDASKPGKPRATTTATAGAEDKATASTNTRNPDVVERQDVRWVDEKRVLAMVAEVKGGRDPFKNLMLPTVVDETMRGSRGPVTRDGDLIPVQVDDIQDPTTITPWQDDPAKSAVPQVTVNGIVSGRAGRYAVLTVDGTPYTVMAGEKLPGAEWTVTQITSHGVTLTKGKQSVPFRLSGGS